MAPLLAAGGRDHGDRGGKSTTCALVVAAIDAAGGRPLLAGNVEGFRHTPPMSAIPPEHDGWVVAEVSSYQAAGSPKFLPMRCSARTHSSIGTMPSPQRQVSCGSPAASASLRWTWSTCSPSSSIACAAS